MGVWGSIFSEIHIFLDVFHIPKCIDFLHFLSLDVSRETYNALTNWLTDARMLASQNIVIILCGNKKDLDADREVTFLEASRFAQENGVYVRQADTCWLQLICLHIVTVPIEVTTG